MESPFFSCARVRPLNRFSAASSGAAARMLAPARISIHFFVSLSGAKITPFAPPKPSRRLCKQAQAPQHRELMPFPPAPEHGARVVVTERHPRARMVMLTPCGVDVWHRTRGPNVKGVRPRHPSTRALCVFARRRRGGERRASATCACSANARSCPGAAGIS